MDAIINGILEVMDMIKDIKEDLIEIKEEILEVFKLNDNKKKTKR